MEHREEFPSAGEEDLLRVHTREHLARIREAVEKARSRDTVLSLTPDTNVSGASWEAAAGSAGAGLAACRAVVEGELRNAFVASRPPGHHATPDRAMGFCLFNHVAVAARTLAEESLERVLILDWDVHHGNGTQDIFYEDPDVFYLSLHQSPHYPGTGAAGERGRGPGEGTTLNVPLPAGTPPDAYVEAFDRAVEEAREAFRPDLLLISAGFDVMAGDPLGGQLLEPEHMELLTRRLVAWAEEDFGGRVVGFLEGGYEPGRLGDGVVSVLRGLVAADDLSTGEGV